MNDDCENHKVNRKARVMKYKFPVKLPPNYEMVKFVIGGLLLLTMILNVLASRGSKPCATKQGEECVQENYLLPLRMA